MLGLDHPSTLGSVHCLASVLHDQELYAEAEALYRRVLESRAMMLGSQHPDSSTSVHNLAFIWKHQGQYEEAEELYRRALEGEEATLRPEHRDNVEHYSLLCRIIT